VGAAIFEKTQSFIREPQRRLVYGVQLYFHTLYRRAGDDERGVLARDILRSSSTWPLETVREYTRLLARKSVALTTAHVVAEISATLIALSLSPSPSLSAQGGGRILAGLPAEVCEVIAERLARRVVGGMISNATAAFKGGAQPSRAHFSLYYLVRGREAFPLLHLVGGGADAVPFPAPPPSEGLLRVWCEHTRAASSQPWGRSSTVAAASATQAVDAPAGGRVECGITRGAACKAIARASAG
jgi:hypothetical protein